MGLMLTPTGLTGMAHGVKEIPVAPSCRAATLLLTTSSDAEKKVGFLISSLGKSLPTAAKRSPPFSALWFSACTVGEVHLSTIYIQTVGKLPVSLASE